MIMLIFTGGVAPPVVAPIVPNDVNIQRYDSKNRIKPRQRLVDLGGFYAEAVYPAQYRPLVMPAVPFVSANAAAIPTASAYGLLTGTAQGAATAITPAKGDAYATSILTLAASASSVTNAYVGMAIRITAGAGVGARGTVTAYHSGTKEATINWGTGASGAVGVPALLDGTSVYELSIDCYNRSKILVKTEYSNSTGTANISLVLRDPNGLVMDSAVQVPGNLGVTDKATVSGYFRARSIEIPADGFDTAFVQCETVPTSAAAVTLWAVAI